MIRKICRFIATGFEFGLLPGAPGTYGTVIGVGLYLLVYNLPLYSYILFCITFIFFSVWVVSQSLSFFEGDDPQPVVIDEMAGFIVTMIGHPFSWLNVGLGFVIFRLLDITKPPPIRYIEKRLKGAWGVVIDDVVAGILACIIIWIVRLVFLEKG